MLSLSFELWLSPLWLTAVQMSKLYHSEPHTKSECALKLLMSLLLLDDRPLPFFILSSDPALICSALYELQMLLILTQWPLQLFPLLPFLFCLKLHRRKGCLSKAELFILSWWPVNWYHMQMQTQRSWLWRMPQHSQPANKNPFPHYKQETPQIPNVSYVKKAIEEKENHGLTHLTSHALPIITLNQHVLLQPH